MWLYVLFAQAIFGRLTCDITCLYLDQSHDVTFIPRADPQFTCPWHHWAAIKSIHLDWSLKEFYLYFLFFVSPGEVYDPEAYPSKVSLRRVVSHNPRPSTCPPDDPAYLISHLPKLRSRGGSPKKPASCPPDDPSYLISRLPKSKDSSSPGSSPSKNAVMPAQVSPINKRKSYSPSLLRRSFFNRQPKSRQDQTEVEEKCDVCGFSIKDENRVSVVREENKRDNFHKTCFKCCK